MGVYETAIELEDMKETEQFSALKGKMVFKDELIG